MKGTVDKVTKDLGEVALVEATMKEKPWDTSTMVEFLHFRAQEVIDLKTNVSDRWVSFLRDKTIITKKTEEINERAKEAEELSKGLAATFKAFVSEVLVEFRAKKA